jgi:uncharacterized protein (DUF486 family)
MLQFEILHLRNVRPSLAEMHLRFCCPVFLALNLLGNIKTLFGSLIQVGSPLDFEFYREEFELFQYSLSIHAIRIFILFLYVFQIKMLQEVCDTECSFTESNPAGPLQHTIMHILDFIRTFLIGEGSVPEYPPA